SVTQQNAALVEQASAASKSMEQQSNALVKQIGYFQSGAHAPAPVEIAHVPTPAPRPVAPRSVTPKPVAKRPAAAPRTAAAPAPLARASGDDASSWSEF